MKVKTKTRNTPVISIFNVIIQLIHKKAKRDNIEFNASQLAEAIGVHRSVITKLIHADPQKRVYNPRIDTLVKIITFFRNDGFDICLDDFVKKSH